MIIIRWCGGPLKTYEIMVAAATMGIAVALPYFSALLSFFGGFVFAPTTYFVSPPKK